MKMRSYHSLLLLPLLILTSCSNESSSDLEDFPLVENVTYTNNVKPIIDNNCLGCHRDPPENSAPMPLNTYERVKEFVQNDKIIDRISRSEGQSGLMPVGGPRLPQPVIDLIIKWKAQGLQE
jgi:hypothetical protein